MYFTSWDANVFLCLLSVFPEDVVRGMIRLVKNTHEDHVRDEAVRYHRGRGPYYFGAKGRLLEKVLQELDIGWKWRCPEARRDRIVEWVIDGEEGNSEMLKNMFQEDNFLTSAEGIWPSWDAWGYCECYRYKPFCRDFVSEWYENIHEGRYFLFFKENNTKGDHFEKYWESFDICDLFPEQQLIEDLGVLDGPGIGEPAGRKVEHIDDMF